MRSPACGRGTTIYAARLVGVPAVGVDVSPVAVAIARVKLAKASLASVIELTHTQSGGRVILGDATASIEQMRSKFDLTVTSPGY